MCIYIYAALSISTTCRYTNLFMRCLFEWMLNMFWKSQSICWHRPMTWDPGQRTEHPLLSYLGTSWNYMRAWSGWFSRHVSPHIAVHICQIWKHEYNLQLKITIKAPTWAPGNPIFPDLKPIQQTHIISKALCWSAQIIFPKQNTCGWFLASCWQITCRGFCRNASWKFLA